MAPKSKISMSKQGKTTRIIQAGDFIIEYFYYDNWSGEPNKAEIEKMASGGGGKLNTDGHKGRWIVKEMTLAGLKKIIENIRDNLESAYDLYDTLPPGVCDAIDALYGKSIREEAALAAKACSDYIGEKERYKSDITFHES